MKFSMTMLLKCNKIKKMLNKKKTIIINYNIIFYL